MVNPNGYTKVEAAKSFANKQEIWEQQFGNDQPYNPVSTDCIPSKPNDKGTPVGR
jgi:hypothetical protein